MSYQASENYKKYSQNTPLMVESGQMKLRNKN